MAATFCNQIMGSGLKHLNEYLLNGHNFTRSYPVVPLSGDPKSSSCCCHGTKRYFNKTRIRRIEVKRWGRCWRILSKSKSDDSSTTYEGEKDENISRATLIWRAVKLPIYSVALVPLTVGSAAAYLQTGLHSAKQYLLLLASSVLIITWLNLRSR